jgi:predicted aldo/keto reductase-like oxidoreductase
MQYRPIGKIGMSASVIGLGAEHLDNKLYEKVETIINTALEQGFNIMDVFMPGQIVRENIGKALEGRRDKMLIQGHIGSTDVNEQYDHSRAHGKAISYIFNFQFLPIFHCFQKKTYWNLLYKRMYVLQ